MNKKRTKKWGKKLCTFFDLKKGRKSHRKKQELAEYHRTLEQQLKQRTKELRYAQLQLIHAEKLASLGALVAGIVHEINNPTSSAHTSAYNLKRELEKLKKFLLELASDDADDEILNAFDEKFNSLFNHLITLQESTTRIKNIVMDLRNFSRMDVNEIKKVNLHEGIQTILNLVKAKYKEYVDFVTYFQADPEVEGIAAELNQVFMNILINACQAVKDKQKSIGEDKKGTLIIKTIKEKDHAVISFQDTGIGMSQEVQQRMFDPFFTTRPAGEGVGLGLPISYKIIKEHLGRIEVMSKEGKGTNITLYLPLVRNEVST
jgi:two-component system NtrC family sensor kinase